MAENNTKIENKPENEAPQNKHEKVIEKLPNGTTIVYYQQNLNKCTDVSVGFRIPRLDIPRDGELIGVYNKKLVFYQSPDAFVRIPLIKPGLPHFVEHMGYSSLPNMPKEEIFDRFVRTNTHYNAFTSQDALTFEFNCPSKFNNEIFSTFSKLIFRKDYNEEDLENEKQPVFQELQGTIDDTNYHAGRDILKMLLFDNYDNLTGEEILGIDRKIIQTFDKNQMLKFVNSYFTKENMIISVVSDRPYKEIKALCQKCFVNKAPSNEATIVRTPEPVYSFNNDDLLLMPDRRAKTANIAFVLKGVPNFEENEIYSVVEDFILNNFNGRLMAKLRNKNGKVYTPYFVSENWPGISLKLFEAQTTPQHVTSVMQAMTDILSDLNSTGITDAEYKGFKEMWQNRRERAISVKHNKSGILFDKVLHNQKPFVGEFNKKISMLTKEDINKYLKETYAHAKCCLVLSGKYDEKSLIPFDQVLKFRPLNKYMDENYIDKEGIDDFYNFLLNAPEKEINAKIKYVLNQSLINMVKEPQTQPEQTKEQENKSKSVAINKLKSGLVNE